MNPAYTILLHHKLLKLNNCSKCKQKKYSCQCQIIKPTLNKSKTAKQKT